MEKDSFTYRLHSQFGITSEVVPPEVITEGLGIVPDRTYRKGEQSISKHSGSIITKPHNLWAIRSKIFETGEESITQAFDYLKSVLLSKSDIIKEYKYDTRFEVSIWIWIETDNTGIGIDLSEEEMSFLHEHSNNIHFSIFTHENFEK